MLIRTYIWMRSISSAFYSTVVSKAMGNHCSTLSLLLPPSTPSQPSFITHLRSLLTGFPPEWGPLFFLTWLEWILAKTRTKLCNGEVGLSRIIDFKEERNSKGYRTWGCRTRRIQVGGTTTAAWAPREQGSSICCSMKHETLLWYWKGREATDPISGYGSQGPSQPSVSLVNTWDGMSRKMCGTILRQ